MTLRDLSSSGFVLGFVDPTAGEADPEGARSRSCDAFGHAPQLNSDPLSATNQLTRPRRQAKREDIEMSSIHVARSFLASPAKGTPRAIVRRTYATSQANKRSLLQKTKSQFLYVFVADRG